MAHLQHDAASDRYRIRFRFAGQEYKRSIKTADPRSAEAARVRIEETIRLIEAGRLQIPEGADPGRFIMSDGRATAKPEVKKILTVEGLIKLYRDGVTPGAKELSTLACEEIHIRHFLKHLPPKKAVQSLVLPDLQRYADARRRDTYRGKTIGPDTVRKELATFRLIWNWGVQHRHLAGPAPVQGVALSKPDEKPPFQTWEEIGKAIGRGGLSAAEIKALWASLFLDTGRVNALLDHVEATARHPFVYPMFVFVAHTGARRSEVLRSRIDDFDFGNGVVHLREKKKSRSRSVTYRHVDLTERLTSAMRTWFAMHPGGFHALAQADGRPLTVNDAVHYFRTTLAGSEWQPVKGFHVFRHSFASNTAAAGIDQRVIDAFLGHQTEEMRKRYRHLFPGQRKRALLSVFG